MDASLRLREATDDEIDQLTLKSEQHLPESLTVYGLLSIGFKRRMVDRSFTKIWVPVVENFPFFILITGVVRKPTRNNLTAFWNPDEVSLSDAKTLLRSLPNWDWKNPTFFNAVSVASLTQIEEIMLGKDGLAYCNIVGFRNYGYALKLANENKLKTAPISAKNVVLAPVLPKFIPEIHSKWIYNYSDSCEGILWNAKHLPSMVAYAREDETNCILPNGFAPAEEEILNGGYKPVSWAISRLFGDIGFTFTSPEYRNKGLASAVTAAVAKNLLEMGICPYIIIGGVNPASEKFHGNIGFERYSSCGYCVYIPKGMQFSDF